MPFVELITVDRCRAGAGTFVEHDGLDLAVFISADRDRVIVLDNTCPHAGGNLAAGTLDGHIVSCPWHHWKFDVRTGTCVDAPRARVRRYNAELRRGVVFVDLT